MPTDETDRSLANEFFEEAFGGDQVKLGGNGAPPITMGPLAQHDPNEDPVAYNRRLRADYHRGLAAHGLRETEDGQVIEKDAVISSIEDAPSPESLVAAVEHDEEAEDKEASYQPAGMLSEQEGERPPAILHDAKKPEVSDFPAEAKRKTQNALLKKLKSREKNKTVVDAKKTQTPADVGQPGDERSPANSRTLPDVNATWSAASTGAQDKVAEMSEEKEAAYREGHDDIKLDEGAISILRQEWGGPAPDSNLTQEEAENILEKVAVEHTPFGEFALNAVGLPPDAVGEWVWEVAEAAGEKLKELAGLDEEGARQALDWEDPNPFLASHVLEVMLGEEWVGWEPETVKTELERRIGDADIAFDRILAIKLMVRKPSLFFTNLRAAEKITVALSDTEISPGDLEDLAPEWISLAVAVHAAMRNKGAKEPVYSEKVAALLAGNLIEHGLVLAPTLLMPIDKLLERHVNDEGLRGEVINRYVEALVEGPANVEDAISIQVNRLLACHVAPLGVFAEM